MTTVNNNQSGVPYQARPFLLAVSGLAWCGAQKLGVKILSEKDFLNMIGHKNPK